MLAHYCLRVGGREGRLLSGRVLSSTAVFDEASLFQTRQWLVLELRFEDERPLAGLVLEIDLFARRNPRHSDLVGVVWNGDPRVERILGAGRRVWVFETAAERRPGVLRGFLGLGIEHILTGYDHICFLIALLVGSRRLRSLLGVVTAFTLAHSVSLALAAFGVVRVPGSFVELAIALSIAYVACENLLRRAPKTLWIEAFCFGLVHGLGFAGFLAEALSGETLIPTALLGFNAGVELGQLALVAPLALLLRLMPGRREVEPEDGSTWLTPRWLRLGASGVVALLGFYWFAERAGFLP